MMLRWALVGSFLLVFAVVCGQQYAAQQFSIREGLPQSEVTAIAEDHLGYLWIGTGSGGIVKFDGKQFISFSTKDGLLSNFVTDIGIDTDNNVWVSHLMGVSKFDGKNFRTFAISDTTRMFGKIKSIRFDNDTLLLPTSNGMLGKIYRDSVYTWKYHPYVNSNKWLYSIQQSNDRALYFFYDNGPVVIRKDGKVSTAPLKFPPLSKEMKFGYPQFITNYKNRVVAFASRHFVSINDDGSVNDPGEPIPAFPLFHDDDTNEWWHRDMKTDSIIVSSVSGEMKVPIPVTTKFIYKDRENNFWAATADRGLYKISKKKIYLNESTAGLKINAILKISPDEYWFGTFGQGLYRFKNEKASLIYFDRKFPRRNGITGLVMSPENQIWVSTDFGVAIFNVKGDSIRWMSRRNGYPFYQVTQVNFDGAGTPWLSTMNIGSVVMEKSGAKILNEKRGKNFTNMVYTSYYSPFHKKMVLGSDSKYQLADTSGAVSVSIPSLKNSSIVSLASYQDSLVLIGSNGAGVLIHSPTAGVKANLTKATGFVSDFVYFVKEDSDGNIWVGTEKGVSKLKLNEQFQIVKHQFYETSETNQDACLLDGRFLFGTIDGLYQFSDSTSDPDGGENFPLHFTEVETDVLKHLFHVYTNELAAENVTLPYDHSSIRFAFNAIEKSDPDIVRYSYKLENFDSDWSISSSTKQVSYTNLPPGEYTFRARAVDMITGIEKNELVYSFTVTPPFYKTPAFIFLITCLFMLVVITYIYLRIRANINRLVTIEKIRSEQQAMLRKEMAQDFHDEMGNQLARIINFTSQLQLQPVIGDNHRTLYKKIEDTAKNLYNGTREFIWSMNPDNEKLHHVFNHIKDFGETLFGESDIRFLTDNKSKSTLSLPFGYAREITLIFKEALTNVFKYSRAGEVRLILTATPQGFEMSVADNGIGFSLQTTPMGNGLSNMQNRANKMKAEFSIFSEPGKGTSISLYLDDSFHTKSNSLDKYRSDLAGKKNVIS
jgi:signal transduction histidine kinase/ligand-binding sensor domain-containing protein